MNVSRVIPAIVIITASGAGPALAQSRPRADVAVQAAMLRLSDGDATNVGVGARLTFDVSRWAAIDAEIGFFPSDHFNVAALSPAPGTFVYERRRAEAFLGIRAGRRGERFGVFAKARPGFTKLDGQRLACRGEVCSLFLPPPGAPQYRTEFAFDLGGVLEFYPTPRVVTRIDLSDVMIRHRSAPPPCTSCTSHNFGSRLGVGFRF